jgi:hypothetical protein
MPSQNPGGCNCGVGPGPCSQTFNVQGCGHFLVGVTVGVYASSGGALLVSGATDSSGNVTLSWTGSCTVWVAITQAGYVSYGQVNTLVSGDTTNINLTLASGYTCCQCAIPNTTLHYTWTAPGCVPSSGSGILTYAGLGTWEMDTPPFNFVCSGMRYALYNTIAGCIEYATGVICSPLSLTFIWLGGSTCPGGNFPYGCLSATFIITL